MRNLIGATNPAIEITIVANKLFEKIKTKKTMIAQNP